MDESTLPPFLTAREAADALGIRRDTLYAYVSRGMIRSEPAADGRRSRRYAREDVERLLRRKEARRDPARVAAESISWGMPVVDSDIALIDGGRLFYRGRDAVELAESASVEEAAALLWTGDPAEAGRLFDPPPASPSAAVAGHLGRLSGLEAIARCQAVLPVAAAEDDSAWDLRPPAVAATGARILRLLVHAALGVRHAPPQGGTSEGIAGRLAAGWRVEGAAGRSALSAALVLCADHELNVSTFTVRCVASAAASPYAAVGAGLAALEGARHGGMTRRVSALLAEAGTAAAVRRVAADRLRRGEGIPGFGHRLYPAGDPRAAALLVRARALGGGAALAPVEALVQAGRDLLGEEPALDVGLVAVARAAALPDDAPLTLFALGRTLGWIAHAIEEYARGELIRPRARYVGEMPRERTAAEGAEEQQDNR